jgi:tetratricopeptide (TPR) repeat protein
MKESTEQTANETPDGQSIDDYLLHLLAAGANEIRQRLRFDEDTYDRFGRLYNQRGRDYYIYAVLDEIEQAGISLGESKEFFDETPEATPPDEHGRRITRNILQTAQRDQSLLTRRLIEILIELINFSQANSNAYFDHYLLYKELGQYKKRRSDFKTYFDITNSNGETAIELLKSAIADGERSLQIDKCWYLKRPKGGSPQPRGETDFLPFQTMFNQGLSLATRSERAVLGFHYGEAFREPSHSIHLNIGGVQRAVSFDFLKARRGQIVILALNCLLRCRRLVGIRSRTGCGAQIARVLSNGEVARRMYRHITRSEITRGDFVTVLDRLCEVVAVKKSKYGYRSFKVRYLSTPLAEEKEDWFPALNLTKVGDGKKIRKDVIQLLRSVGATPPSPRRIRQAMRDSALDLWQRTQPRKGTV